MLILLSFFSLIHIIKYTPNFALLTSENLQFNTSLFCFMIANANGAAATSDCNVPFQAATSDNEVNIDQNNLLELLYDSLQTNCNSCETYDVIGERTFPLSSINSHLIIHVNICSIPVVYR